MTMLSTSLGPGSSYLIETTGTKPYGVVDTPSFVRLNPHRGKFTCAVSCGRIQHVLLAIETFKLLLFTYRSIQRHNLSKASHHPKDAKLD
eukprot:810191-Amorphochlora_amoeboformis.AAC.1